MIPIKIDFNPELLSTDQTNGIEFDDLIHPNLPTRELGRKVNVCFDDVDKKPNWYIYNGKYYYFKNMGRIFYIMNELLGEYISHYMSLPTVHYKMALKKGKVCGLISKNFRKMDKKYKRACDLFIFSYIKYHYILNSSRADTELKRLIDRMLVKELFCDVRDRSVNILCEKEGCFTKVATFFDYEKSFIDAKCDAYTNPLFIDVFSNEQLMKSITIAKLNNLMCFDEYLKTVYDKMLEFNMERALDNIESQQRINIPNEVKEYYVDYTRERKLFLGSQIKK